MDLLSRLARICTYLIVYCYFPCTPSIWPPDMPGGAKIAADGKIYSFTTDLCPGGVFLKKPMTVDYICAHGYFFRRKNGCRMLESDIVAAKQYGCINQTNQIQALIPLTNPELPTEHTITFFEEEDSLKNLRRYTYLQGVRNRYIPKERGAPYVVVTNTHNTPKKGIGKLCYEGRPYTEGAAYLAEVPIPPLEGDDTGESGFFSRKCAEPSVEFPWRKAQRYPFSHGYSDPERFAGEVVAVLGDTGEEGPSSPEEEVYVDLPGGEDNNEITGDETYIDFPGNITESQEETGIDLPGKNKESEETYGDLPGSKTQSEEAYVDFPGNRTTSEEENSVGSHRNENGPEPGEAHIEIPNEAIGVKEGSTDLKIEGAESSIDFPNPEIPGGNVQVIPGKDQGIGATNIETNVGLPTSTNKTEESGGGALTQDGGSKPPNVADGTGLTSNSDISKVTVGGQTPMKNGQVPVANGQDPVANGQVPVVNGQVPVVNGQVSVVNGQIPVANGQVPVINGQVPAISGQMKPGESKPEGTPGVATDTKTSNARVEGPAKPSGGGSILDYPDTSKDVQGSLNTKALKYHHVFDFPQDQVDQQKDTHGSQIPLDQQKDGQTASKDNNNGHNGVPIDSSDTSLNGSGIFLGNPDRNYTISGVLLDVHEKQPGNESSNVEPYIVSPKNGAEGDEAYIDMPHQNDNTSEEELYIDLPGSKTAESHNESNIDFSRNEAGKSEEETYIDLPRNKTGSKSSEENYVDLPETKASSMSSEESYIDFPGEDTNEKLRSSEEAAYEHFTIIDLPIADEGLNPDAEMNELLRHSPFRLKRIPLLNPELTNWDPFIEEAVYLAKMTILHDQKHSSGFDFRTGKATPTESIFPAGESNSAFLGLPNTKWFKILQASLPVTSALIADELIPAGFLETALNIFGYLFRAVPDDPDEINEEVVDTILDALGKCSQNIRKVEATSIGCPRKFHEASYQHPDGTMGNRKFDKFPPKSSSFRSHSNDVVVEVAWNLIHIALCNCFTSFTTERISEHHRLYVYMKMIFRNEQIQKRWFSAFKGVDAYAGILAYGDYKPIMYNFDKLKAATHSECEGLFGWLPKPELIVRNYANVNILKTAHHVSEAFKVQKSHRVKIANLARRGNNLQPFIIGDEAPRFKRPFKARAKIGGTHWRVKREVQTQDKNDAADEAYIDFPNIVEVDESPQQGEKKAKDQQAGSSIGTKLEIWGGLAYCLQANYEEYTDGRYRMLGITPSIDSLQEFCNDEDLLPQERRPYPNPFNGK